MAKTEQAPSLDYGFLKRLAEDSELFGKLRELAFSDPEYHPWRYVKYHAPEGIDARDLWRALVFVRNIRPVVELENGRGGHFSIAHPEALKRRLDGVYSVLHYTIETDLPFRGLDEARLRMYLQRSLREEAISSSQLEGAVTTRRVAREMLLTKREPKDESERMILNNYLTMDRLVEWKKRPLSLELLKEIHRQLTDGVLDDSKRGRFRRDEDQVVVAEVLDGEVVHFPPPCAGLEERLQKIADFANDDGRDKEFYYPVEKAAILHFLIGYEHPFCDGNGRTARAVFYWYLLRKGWWLVEFLSISSMLKKPPWRKRYNQAYLDVETCGYDLTYFVLFQMDCLMEAAKEFHAHIDRVQQEGKAIEDMLKGVLNRRQLDLVRHARRHRGYPYTVAEHASWQGISLNSARNDLEGLRAKGFLSCKKNGKTKVYSYKGK